MFESGSLQPSASQAFSEAGRQVYQQATGEEDVPTHIAQARTSLIEFTRQTFAGYIDEPAHRLIGDVWKTSSKGVSGE